MCFLFVLFFFSAPAHPGGRHEPELSVGLGGESEWVDGRGVGLGGWMECWIGWVDGVLEWVGGRGVGRYFVGISYDVLIIALCCGGVIRRRTNVRNMIKYITETK